ncbi:protein-L-isoaspartate(D-aspartate) O-methyltransferase [Fulvimarina manganoxydans]|uniref:Protein-L-isoaspartate O-methyltransferase n=1 Tax=Fulvimarina manganoxydans TaxID=937218 RepID=A0A1W2AKJ5_9HYPH|nr:protein-L-isoaspartate O-methyltransferase [Fulvimarina manganoxydans]MCK5934773.1 protein-L-isoaspartate O-methyltransferase [Fulvimarina manganoxydans]SMC61225.1 protein-L-isoaspartate(D-aspartate) O-methyltransferase [Fulvimarina manganoxydans]
MDFETARTRLVDNQIRTTDVTSHSILRAFLTVPREEFVPASRRPLAYIDEDLPIGNGRFLMEASPFAKLLQLASITPEDVVLDVGCGTGYGAAVLSHLASSVVALEEDESLAETANDTLTRLDYVSCTVVTGPLNKGYETEAPYDVILFEGAIEVLPETFLEQLRPGGRLVAVIGRGLAAEARIYIKDHEGIVSDRFGFNCAIKPLPGFQKKAEFVF